MKKIELYKKVIEISNVIVHHNSTPLFYLENWDRGIDFSLKLKNVEPSKEAQYWSIHKEYKNSKEKYLEHFGDKLASVFLTRKTVVIEMVGDKISLKRFHYETNRNRGVHWFSKFSYMEFLTLNTKTGVLYTGRIVGLHNKRRKKKIFTNKFWSNLDSYFYDAANSIMSPPTVGNVSEKQKKLKEIFFSNIVDWDLDVYPIHSKIEKSFHKYYLTKKGVRFPNNFSVFNHSYDLIPRAKDLKRAKNKFIDAVMIHNGISGDKLKKRLHQITNPPTLNCYKFFVGLVGQERLHQNDNILSGTLNYPNHYDWEIPKELYASLSDNERKNAWMCILDKMYEVPTLRDHLIYLNFLREEGLDYKWKARNKKDFNDEHKFLSDEYNKFKYGLLHRKYSQDYKDFFQDSLKVGEKEYKIVVLESQLDFHDESDYQSNCVKTYLSRPGSFIVSVREGENRATVEYNVRSFRYEWLVERPQSLGKFNEPLDTSWDDVLELLDIKVKELFFEYGYDYNLIKIRGGKEAVYNLEWTEDGFRKWDNTIDNSVVWDYFL